MEYSYPEVGAHIERDHCTFTVWAPDRKQVSVEIDGRNHSLNKDERGFWSATVPNVKPGSKYFFVLDSDRKLPDPASRSQREGVHSASTVIEKEFSWSDQNWKGLSLGEMIIYELHVGTFSPEGTFEGILNKLPYLSDLGVNAIEVMPLAQFPGSRNWGYDGVYPFAVQDSYGGPLGLKKLVDAAHRHGIAVILDVVYNHQGPEGNYLGEFGPYFTDKYKTGWGRAINFDDAQCDGVRNFYWQNALQWLDEFHIDGLRLDAVHAIWDFSANHFIDELSKKVKSLESRVGKKKVLIAEFDLNNPKYIVERDRGGFALDGQWIDEYHHALHSVITREVDGYYEDFGSLEHLRRSLRDSYVYTGQYSIHRKKHFGKTPEEIPFDRFVVFAQNHDQVGNRMLGDRLTKSLSFDELKLTAAAYILSPHIPMLFMGEEYGEKNPFQYFISHTDRDLVEAVRKGRKEEFSYFKWEGEIPDPQSEKTYNTCKLSWSFDKNEDASTLLQFYKELIHLRRMHEAFKNYERSSLELINSHEDVIAFRKHGKNSDLIIALNFSKDPRPMPHDSGKLLLDSSDPKWKGSPLKQDHLVAPKSVIVLETKL